MRMLWLGLAAGLALLSANAPASTTGKPAPKAKAAAPILARDLILKNNSANLQYSWRVPPEVGVQPTLFALMRGKAEAGLAAGLQQADRDAAEARKSGYPVRQYTDLRYWTVTADTPRLLALSGELYGYTGGAHGNTGYDAVIWDRATQKTLTFPELFSDRAKARAILEPLVCAALAKEQAAKRGDTPASADFSKCPALSEASLLPYGGTGPVAYAVRVIFAPYVAGSYAEGSYVLTVQLPDTIKPLVKPEYREQLFGVVQ